MATKEIRPKDRVVLVRALPKEVKSTIDLDIMETGDGPTSTVTSDLTPEQAYELVDFITENVKRPEPPKFVPQDGIYTLSWGGAGTRIYKYRNNAWRNAEGHVLEGEQERLTEDAKKGRLVRLVRETGEMR